MKRFCVVSFVLVAVIVLAIAGVSAQLQGRTIRGRFGYGIPPNAKYDGAFIFCRVSSGRSAGRRRRLVGGLPEEPTSTSRTGCRS